MISKEELIDSFGLFKKAAEFEIYCPDNKMSQYFYGNIMFFFRQAFIGEFYDSYLSPYSSIVGSGPESVISKIKHLDQAHHYVKERDIEGAVQMLDQLGQSDEKIKKQMEPWIEQAKVRLDRQVLIRMLMTHSDVLAKKGYNGLPQHWSTQIYHFKLDRK